MVLRTVSVVLRTVSVVLRTVSVDLCTVSVVLRTVSVDLCTLSGPMQIAVGLVLSAPAVAHKVEAGQIQHAVNHGARQ